MKNKNPLFLLLLVSIGINLFVAGWMVNSFVSAPIPMGARAMPFEHNPDFMISRLERRLSYKGGAVVREVLAKKDQVNKQFREDMLKHREKMKKEVNLEDFNKENFIKSGSGILKIFESKAKADAEIFASIIEQLSVEDRRVFVSELDNMFKEHTKSPRGRMPPPPPSREGEMPPPPMHMHDDM